MVKRLLSFMLSGLLIFTVSRTTAQVSTSFDKYHSNNEVKQILEQLQREIRKQPNCTM